MNVYGSVPPAPVKVMFGAEAFRHTDVVPLIVAVGKGLTVTVAVPDCGCVHAELLASLTLSRVYVYVPMVVVGAGTVTLFPDVVVTVSVPPELMVYVNVYGAVPDAPVNVIAGGSASLQTSVVPLIVAVGRGFTVTVALPDCACMHAVELASLTLTSE